MSNFPSVKAKDFIKVIENLGFYFDRQKGSHALYKNSQGLRVVVPIHSGKDLKPGTLMGMIQDIGIDKETFFQLFIGEIN
ncbi:MAG: type II toxin-antitoxin system HicA family toxin [Planktothrix sp.]